MTSLQDQLRPFCIPLFDVEGCDGKLYSSQFIVADGSPIRSLVDCRGTTVAVNHSDSNSGMNVLRYELAKLGAGPGFFNHVEISGGHWKSIEAIAQGHASVAAIDCVSWQLAMDFMPQICSRIRIIGHSVKTVGLPFVIPHSRYRPDDCRLYIKALNQALAQAPQASRDRLHLSGFEAVELEHYESILELENYALDAGYAELN